MEQIILQAINDKFFFNNLIRWQPKFSQIISTEGKTVSSDLGHKCKPKLEFECLFKVVLNILERKRNALDEDGEGRRNHYDTTVNN